MAGIDNNVAIIGDWVPPTPSPRAFFSTILGDDIASRTTLEHLEKNRTKGFIFGSQGQIIGGNSGKDVQYTVGAPLTELGSLSGNKSSSRGGLVERMASRAGFNAPRLNTDSIRSAELSLNLEMLSPYLTIPPGLSPTTLLESPVFLSDSLAQPFPTTGKFSFVPYGSSKSSGLISEPPDKSKDNIFDDFIPSSLAFKPVMESTSSFSIGATDKINPVGVPQQSFPRIEFSVQSENPLSSHVLEQTKLQSHNRNLPGFQTELSRPSPEKDDGDKTVATDIAVFDRVGGSVGQSPPVDDQQDIEGDQRASGDSVSTGVGGGTPSEDGYNWRKYGQKQVKGSEYPRSYYKCTHPNCPVKKKVERSLEGHITEIIYKGAHNHPKPPSNRQTAISSSHPLMDMQLDIPDQMGSPSGTDNDPTLRIAEKGTAVGTTDWRHENVEVTSSTSAEPEFGSSSFSVLAQNAADLEVGDAIDASSIFSNDEDEDEDRATHASFGYDGEGDESESKRRKIESYATEMGGTTKAIREPRVVVQTTSEIDILDDGYRWRKYGQKVVKGNPNPRSYYKCTNAGCAVRKHVERASHDLKSVITTYEGKHNHDVPAARNSSNINSTNSNAMPVQRTTAVQTHPHRPEPSQVYNRIPRFERFAPPGSFSLPGRQQLGPSPSFSFGMNQTGLANLAMAGLGPGEPKIPVMPLHPYLAQQRAMNQMEFVLPRGEPKLEPVAEPSSNLPSNPSVYRQIMSRLPLGPQM